MKTEFQYSRSYEFLCATGRRHHYFFNLVDHCGGQASFKLIDKGNDDAISGPIEMDGDIETANLLYDDKEFTLRADRWHPKGYSMTPEGHAAKKEDFLKDVHMHTCHNRHELEASQFCYCISCRTFFKPEEIDSYTDEGNTAICPYCGCDAVLGEACGIKLTDDLLEQLHNKYFNYNDTEDNGMEIYIATDLLFTEGAYRFNAVYAFKSMTSVKSYEKYLKNTGENHRLVVTPTMVADLDHSLQVITEFEVKSDLPEYKSTTVLDDWDDVRDYVANVKERRPDIKVEHDTVKIRSRFSPSFLHDGWA